MLNKDKLFKGGKPDKWELREEDMKKSLDLLNDKVEAFKVMIPGATKQVDDYEKTYIYLSMQCYKEIKKFNKNEVEGLLDHLQDYSSRMGETLTTNQLNWANFDQLLTENEGGDSKEDSKS